jgi:hypothetical protein
MPHPEALAHPSNEGSLFHPCQICALNDVDNFHGKALTFWMNITSSPNIYDSTKNKKTLAKVSTISAQNSS